MDLGTANTIIISDERARAIATVSAHYDSVFSDDPASAHLRETYALRKNPIPDPEHRRLMAGFFFWAAWATVTERPDSKISYTHNFPHDPVVGNTPTASSFMWSMFSILLMIDNTPSVMLLPTTLFSFAEEINDYTRRDNVAEKLAKKFGAAMGDASVRALHAVPALR